MPKFFFLIKSIYRVLYTYEPKLEAIRPGGRVVGENQKESFKLIGQALSLISVLVVLVVVVAVVVFVVVVVGLVIPSIKLGDKAGGL